MHPYARLIISALLVVFGISLLFTVLKLTFEQFLSQNMISQPILDPRIPLLQVFGMSLDLGLVLILREDIA